MGRKSFYGLLVMATRLEAQAIINNFEVDPANFRLYHGKNKWDQWMLLITGVGMVNTALHTGLTLASYSFNLAINAGVAGVYSKDIPLGTVVRVSTDSIPELGAEDHEDFLNLNALGIFFDEQAPLEMNNRVSAYEKDSVFPAEWTQLPAMNAVTVNKAHGNAHSIEAFSKKYSPELESMEGAAFFMACKEFGLPYLQLRAISNYVERRDKSGWKMGLALQNLQETLTKGLAAIKV
jgi:futalosine hydrolase